MSSAAAGDATTTVRAAKSASPEDARQMDAAPRRDAIARRHWWRPRRWLKRSRPNGSSPLAGKRVIDNGNTSGHVPQHARQLCQGPGDGGRRRVPRRPEIGSHAGRKSGHQ
ncbi:hypothetical protein SADUNF_Sadunf11G0072200 [Salix dunnii]|uniref:Uncharacterized protein n=1 Tax=Salix dunnii TaxID=1413687 RepID=A0A835JK48_9ROSI|nr:hypothetical protein SADUNF_Sadunf11G0072200 [Salix dunnii]